MGAREQELHQILNKDVEPKAGVEEIGQISKGSAQRPAEVDDGQERQFVETLARKYLMLLAKKFPACFAEARDARSDNRGKHMKSPENREKMNQVVRPVQDCWRRTSECLYEKFKPVGETVLEETLRKQLKTAKVCAKSKKLCVLLSLQNSLLHQEIVSGPGTEHEFQQLSWDKSKSFFGWTGFTVVNPDDFFFRFYSLHRLVMFLASRRQGGAEDAFAGDDMDLVMSKLKDEMYEDLDLSCDVVSGLFHDLGFKTLSFKQALGGLEPFVYTCTTSNKKKARV
ncbi:hypothetical protein GUITHDRAFT_162947 [Guillardia theta CCMP2712]|uniref:Uncharacterized protein n=1 Tax=Guillardia theta (strain CCMP2712) TaxID=905079 RepID=L1JEB1_GUITC|nr:hypothetical protein GUITHDRAFT_162947 [Guillardia theta CCMP2712]EKX46450.1 hypothetical protein GUITHDRAFT_162947 [Guillardia theta CCMP2712]|eukprot:XP_005833430.1 hypothetical protein GUITHDRAFT_162947 [Guillardia theta CCMP2712]